MATNRSMLRLAGAFCACVFSAGLVTSAEAALVSRLNGQAVYDTDLNITWLADANLAANDTFGVSGIVNGGTMTWDTAQSWIGAVNASNYLGYSDWRLPVSLQPDPNCSYQSGSLSAGYNCSGSEMGHLFYTELEGVAGTSILTTHNSYLSLFSNVQVDGNYWTGTEYAPDTAGSAWIFGFLYGGQDADYKSAHLRALVVRSGDVTAVPVPAAVWLFGSGLVGLFGLARRRQAL